MFEIIDNENILSIDLDGVNIHNFPKLETSLSINGDNLVIEYENENVQIPYDECSDPSEASASALYTAVLAILNNIPSSGEPVDLTPYVKRDGSTTGATGAQQEFTLGARSSIDEDHFTEFASEYMHLKSVNNDVEMYLNMQNGLVTLQNIDGTIYSQMTKGGFVTADLHNGVACYSERRTIKKSIEAGDLRAMNGAPIELIAAPGAGFMINPLSVVAVLNYSDSSFDAGTRLWIKSNSADYNLFEIAAFLENSATSRVKLPQSGNAGVDTSNIGENKSILLTSNQDSVSGGGSLDLYITYEIIQV